MKRLLQSLLHKKRYHVKVFGRCKISYRAGSKKVILDGEYQPHSNVACVVYVALEQEWDTPEGQLISPEERRLLKTRIENEAPKIDGVNVKVEI